MLATLFNAILLPTAAATPILGNDVLESIKPLPPAQKREPQLKIEPTDRPPLRVRDESAKVKINALRFTGHTVLPESVLRAAVASRIGKELGFAELRDIADVITQLYRRSGYPVARAYLPAQDLRAGELEVAIVEGRYDKIEVDNQARIAAYPLSVMDSLQPGQVVHEPELERALLLLNDLPGIDVSAALRPGAATGTSDLVAQVQNGPRLSGALDVDNHGSRYVGKWRAGATVNLNNPLAIGDQLSLRGTSAGENMNYGRLAYSLPVDGNGTRLGVAYARLGYQLGEELEPLDVQGRARIASASLTHPFVRSRTANLYGQLGVDRKDIEESFLGVTTSRDEIRVASIGLSGDNRFGQSAMTNYGVVFYKGVGRENDPEASRVNTDGSFSKMTLDVSHLHRFTSSFGVGLRAAGQLSSTALLSAEQFSAGGLTGVRAYPQGEALGDRGYVASLELLWNARGGALDILDGREWGDFVQWTFFVETGETAVRDPLPGQDRSRQLSGAGIGFNVGLPNNFAIKGSYARPLDNDEKSTADNVSDGRFWLQAVKWF